MDSRFIETKDIHPYYTNLHNIGTLFNTKNMKYYNKYKIKLIYYCNLSTMLKVR